MTENPSEQVLIEQGRKLQALLVETFTNMLLAKTTTPTDRATIARWLKDNNFVLSEKDLPKDLQDLLADQRRQKPKIPLPDPSAEF